MAKKFINHTPTLLVIVILVLLGFICYLCNQVTSIKEPVRREIIRTVGVCNGGGDPLSNPYVPPIKCDAGSLMPNSIPTQQFDANYTQIGIITKQFAHNNEILPLMGRRTLTSRNKWQYYTIAGGGAGGNLQAKLPVKVKGRNCSGEYGCEEISNGDEVYVEGYQDNFRATVYENGLFSYIP